MSKTEPIEIPNPVPKSERDVVMSYILVAIIIILTLILLIRIFSGNTERNLKGPVVIDVHRTRHIEVKELAQHLRNRKEKLNAALAGKVTVALYKPQIEKITKNLKKFVDQIPQSPTKDELMEQLMVDIHSQEGSLEYEDNKKTGKDCLNEMNGYLTLIENALVKGLIATGFLDLTPMTDLLLNLENEIENNAILDKKEEVQSVGLTGIKVFNGKAFGESKEIENHLKLTKEFNRGNENTIGSMEFENFE